MHSQPARFTLYSGPQSDEVYFPHIIRLIGLQTNLSDAIAVSRAAARPVPAFMRPD
jgi:hypothetical protein